MEKSENSSDRTKIILEELDEFNKLVNGHRKLLEAIGNL